MSGQCVASVWPVCAQCAPPVCAPSVRPVCGQCVSACVNVCQCVSMCHCVSVSACPCVGVSVCDLRVAVFVTMCALSCSASWRWCVRQSFVWPLVSWVDATVQDAWSVPDCTRCCFSLPRSLAAVLAHHCRVPLPVFPVGLKHKYPLHRGDTQGKQA